MWHLHMQHPRAYEIMAGSAVQTPRAAPSCCPMLRSCRDNRSRPC
jgi:hypothetical protein